MSEYHIPVLLEESVSALLANPEGRIYADCTFGGGGHTAAILSRLQHAGGRVIAFDRDSDAIEAGRKKFAKEIESGRLTLVHNNFRYIENYAEFYGVHHRLDGILADLGVSSHQFDTAERGFSFRFDAPLDMRMNREAPKTAADFVGEASEEDLERVLRLYGEVDGAGKMARLITGARVRRPVLTTMDLSEAIAPMLPPQAPHKVLAKVYQALRIEVNGEMRSLEKFLEASVHALAPGGRLVVITYHSLEDRMVKNFMRTGNVDGTVTKDMFGRIIAPLEQTGKKPVIPAEDEIGRNTRARSAKLRTARLKGGQ